MKGTLAMIRLLYVSVSELPPSDALDEVTSIVKSSVQRNVNQGVTGALIYTGAHFAQALEGDDRPIEHLMKRIRADARHRSILEVHRDSLTDRRFATWAMAYRGQATYVDQPIRKLLAASSGALKSQAIQHLYDLMREFVN